MNHGQELFIARGKLTWSRGIVQSCLAKLHYCRASGSTYDFSALEEELRRAEEFLAEELEEKFPPNPNSRQRKKRNGQGTTAENTEEYSEEHRTPGGSGSETGA